MNRTEAQALGAAACHAGMGNFPLAVPAIAAELKDAKPGEKTYFLRAFNAGWTAANLAA